LPKNVQIFLNFGPEAELLNFAVFSLIFDARKKIFSVLDRGILCADFVFISLLIFCLRAELNKFKVYGTCVTHHT